MAETVKLPGVGPVKKTTAMVGGVVVVGIAVVMYARRAQQSKAAGLPAAIDPVTGFPYGSPEDVAALAAQNAGTPPVTGSGGGGGVPDTNSPGAIGSGGLPTFGSNAAWAQYVESYLVDQRQADPSVVGNAIGKYLTGNGVTSDQQTVINNAIGIGGYPPVNGIAGFPPSMHLLAPAPAPVPAAKTYRYVVQIHQLSAATPARGLIERFSDKAVATDNAIQTALTETFNDSHNSQYRTAYIRTRGVYPAGAKIYTHVVKAA